MCWTRLKLTRLVGGAMCLCLLYGMGQLYALELTRPKLVGLWQRVCAESQVYFKGVSFDSTFNVQF
jgi:hypothetical protein